MKKWMYFVLVFLSCGFVCLDNVLAVCNNAAEVFIERESYNYEGSRDYYSTKRVVGGTYTLDDGESICGAEAGDISVAGQLYKPVILTCTAGRLEPSSDNCGKNSLCVSNKSNNTKGKANCISGKDCSYDKGGVYYLGDYSYNINEKTFEEGSQGCFDNVRKECIPQTNTWKTIEDCGSKYCVMKVGTYNEITTSCGSGCDGSKYESKRCKTGKAAYETCYFYDSKWHEKAFSDPNCISCQDTVDGPECVKLEDDGSYTKFCTVIQGDSEPVNAGKEGDFICNRSGTVLYKCDTTSSNYKKNGAYSTFENCSSKNLVCGAGDDGKAACITKDEAGRNDQSVVRSTVNISISTDTGFMCIKNGKDGVSTAFGCIPITASGLASELLPILFGIAGGISFLRMVLGFIMIATSSGDEKKFIEAKSIISSAIIGLLVSIFAIFLFRLIFVNILQIPGLS